MDTLLTFVGPGDPYAPALAGENERLGPILTLLAARRFSRVVLLSTPDTEEAARKTAAAVASRFPACRAEVCPVPLYETADYREILAALRETLAALHDRLRGARCAVSVASGTAQMHACWTLLAAAGELPARLLDVRLPCSPGDAPVVLEADPAGAPFPVVDTDADRVREEYGPPPALPDVLRQIGIVGEDPGLKAALERAALAAPTDVPVLIRGETGTGKELFARLIHRLSERARAPFVSLNCGAVPRDLVESMLFGYARGAFTGATRDHRGKFETADGGTLFLDELLDLPRESQVKLLRVIEDGIVEPLGSARSRRVSVRVIAATNSDPAVAIRAGEFRDDLFHRIAAIEIVLPPLRERVQDIPKLALHLLDQINGQLRRPKRLSAAALARLQGHAWRGNVRDLRNTLLRSAMFCREDEVDAGDLCLSDSAPGPDPFAFLPQPREGFNLREYLEEVRRRLIERALDTADGNCSRAAQLLGVSPQAVHKFVATRPADSPPV